jgi:hypothetical protein
VKVVKGTIGTSSPNHRGGVNKRPDSLRTVLWRASVQIVVPMCFPLLSSSHGPLTSFVVRMLEVTNATYVPGRWMPLNSSSLAAS